MEARAQKMDKQGKNGRVGEKQEAEKERRGEGQRKSLPRPLPLALSPGCRSPVLGEVYSPEVPTPGSPQRGESEGWWDAQQTH